VASNARYLKAFPDGGFWQGKNFVFDKRKAVSAMDRDGCGGVVKKAKKQKNKSTDEKVLSKCYVCNLEWDHYVGKKNFFTCGVDPVLIDVCQLYVQKAR
jgi:predicted sulfurtransferase